MEVLDDNRKDLESAADLQWKMRVVVDPVVAALNVEEEESDSS